MWLFLWCISSTTKEIERDGVTWGIVLGNKPLKRHELAEPFGVSERTIQRWLDDLEKYQYIKVTRAPYGYILTVRNSKKYTSERVDKNVHSNKDITKINNTTTKTTKENDRMRFMKKNLQ
ncbi:hypothetical protein [Peribacillus tepidiphilus]|uniref:hypothetical protein n=1 Tax=Peribacillus tepidiphilus TaxID=2652445 RepID=UPI0035B5287E